MASIQSVGDAGEARKKTKLISSKLDAQVWCTHHEDGTSVWG